jgi:hypothetical protein
MVGLRKVPDNFGATPGLADFFRQVCDTSSRATASDSQQMSRLRFDLIDSLSNDGCFAYSADMTLMKSNRNCFDPALIFTFLDADNHFPMFPVKDSEWDYFVQSLPKMSAPIVDGPTAAPVDPCAPAPPPPNIYSHLTADRVCVAMPDLNCYSVCGKFCKPVEVQTVSTTPGGCRACYDCEIDEIWYAICATLLTFWLCQVCYNNTSGSWVAWAWSLKEDYSPLLKPLEIGQEMPTSWANACYAFGCLSLVYSFFSYYLINIINYWVVLLIRKNEMCLKVWDFQTALSAFDSPFNSVHYSIWHGERAYSCYNDVCPFRLWGMIFCTWFSIWALFAYWRFHLQLETVQIEAKREEFIIETGGGGGVFGALTTCTVQ